MTMMTIRGFRVKLDLGLCRTSKEEMMMMMYSQTALIGWVTSSSQQFYV